MTSICTAAVNMRGEYIRCELKAPHNGQGHENSEHYMIWQGHTYEQTWDTLQLVLNRLTYSQEMFQKPWLERNDGANWALLHVYLQAPNSYEPPNESGQRPIRHTNHVRLVPCATFDYENWRAWVHDFFADIAVHEVGEWFQDDGERIFAPHHGAGNDPYREHETITDRERRISEQPG
jgi:hypothetical protein